MRVLQNLIETLRQQRASDVNNVYLLAQINAARDELQAISGSFGGDLPVSEATFSEGMFSREAVQGGEAAQLRRTQKMNAENVAPATPGCNVTTTTFSNSTAVAIPDVTTVNSTITAASLSNKIGRVRLRTFITHTFNEDLQITIRSPAGTLVTLSTSNGVGNNNVFNGTLWDNKANPGGQVPYTSNNGLVTDHAYTNLVTATPLAPEESLAAFNGQDRVARGP